MRFEESQTDGRWVIDPLPHPAIDRQLYRFIVEMQFGVHVALHRDMMGAAFAPTQLRVTFGGPEISENFAAPWVSVPVRPARKPLSFDPSWLNADAPMR